MSENTLTEVQRTKVDAATIEFSPILARHDDPAVLAEIAAKVLAAALSHYSAGAERDHASAQIDQVAANILRNE